jgi:hypothetical protein
VSVNVSVAVPSTPTVAIAAVTTWCVTASELWSGRVGGTFDSAYRVITYVYVPPPLEHGDVYEIAVPSLLAPMDQSPSSAPPCAIPVTDGATSQSSS